MIGVTSWSAMFVGFKINQKPFSNLYKKRIKFFFIQKNLLGYTNTDLHTIRTREQYCLEILVENEKYDFHPILHAPRIKPVKT